MNLKVILYIFLFFYQTIHFIQKNFNNLIIAMGIFQKLRNGAW